MIDHDFEQEKSIHPENFEPDVDTENDLRAELDHDEVGGHIEDSDHDCHADTGDDGCDHWSHKGEENL